MAILYQRAVGKDDGYVLFSRGVAYQQNRGLDVDRDGDVEKWEAALSVRRMIAEGNRQYA